STWIPARADSSRPSLVVALEDLGALIIVSRAQRREIRRRGRVWHTGACLARNLEDAVRGDPRRNRPKHLATELMMTERDDLVAGHQRARPPCRFAQVDPLGSELLIARELVDLEDPRLAISRGQRASRDGVRARARA